MVSIGRALMSNPDLILLDELSLGLAPVVIKDIYAQLPQITGSGMSAILVEQDVTRALAAAHRFTCLAEGRIALEGAPGEHDRDAISAAYFGT
jgi:branched-chain amino acid transport system ATP-binding protein